MRADPREAASKLAAAYREIHATAMKGVPICNDALAVEAIGFHDFNGYVVGVMITPWFLNLVAVAQDADCAGAASSSVSSARLRFPAGDVDFNMSELDGFGRLASCSLFSPMSDFLDHETARSAATAALDALFDPLLQETTSQETASQETTQKAPGARAGVDRRALFGGRRTEPSEEVAP